MPWPNEVGKAFGKVSHGKLAKQQGLNAPTDRQTKRKTFGGRRKGGIGGPQIGGQKRGIGG
jgi:hypothetical protein